MGTIHNINKIDDFELFEIFGQDALFTNYRIDRDTVPEDLHVYGIRHGYYGEPAAVEDMTVWVNHFGDIVTKHPIDLPIDGYMTSLNPDDYGFTGEPMTLEQWLKRVEE